MGGRGRRLAARGQLPGTTTGMTAPPLPAMTPVEETLADLWATGTYGTHPMAHIRAALDARQALTAAATRQAGATAPTWPWPGWSPTGSGRRPRGGVVFISLEDETGMANVICPPAVWESHQPAATVAPALLIRGRLERTGAAGRAGGTGGAVNLVASALRPLRVAAASASRDFR